MANRSTGSGQWTDMGNVTPNPRGSYSDAETYKYLDMVSYGGGSYLCLQDDTIGVRPSPGESTDRWFCSSVPGEATPDFKNLVTETKEAARTAKEKASEAETSAKASEISAQAASGSAGAAAASARDAENAKDVVAGYKIAAEKAASSAATSEKNVNDKIAGLDNTFSEKTTSAIETINKSVDTKADEIKNEITATKNSMVDASQKAINDTIDARKTEINNTGASEIKNVQAESATQTQGIKSVAAEQLAAINAAGGTLESAIERYYAMRRTREIYTVEELDPDVTQACTVNRLDALSGLTCTPSTNATAGEDQIGTLEAFRPIEVNWILDDDGNQKITAIEGMPGYKTTGKVNRGIMNMGLYYKKERNAEDNGWLHHWSMLPRKEEGYVPMKECVRPDNTVQGWMLHPKGAAVDIDGVPYVTNGKPVRNKPSYANFAYARKQGPAYCFETDVDAAWVLALTMIKYGTKDLQAYMRGCTAYSSQYNVAVAEENTKRVILTKDQANYFVVGSSVSIGNPGSNTNFDRGNNYMHNIVDSAKITAIQKVDDTYSALVLDVSAPFTTATTYKVSAMHWETGSTDSVQGYDGSPVSNTDGKNICKINGIEIMPGGLSVSGNSVHIIETDSDGNTSCTYYRCDDARLLTTNTDTIISSYAKVGSFPATDNAWKFIKEQMVDFGKGVMYPVTYGGGDKAYWADGWHTGSTPSAGQKSARGLLRRGFLDDGGFAGPSYVGGGDGLAAAWWNILATLSPNAVRGEWQATA